MLDLQTRRFLARLSDAATRPIHELSVTEARAFSRELTAANGPGPVSVHVHDADADGVPVRILAPGGRSQGLVVWLHPGLWIMGGPDQTETVAAKLAERTSCTWLLPRYRLGPEHPHPAAFDDCERAIAWAARQIGELVRPGAPLIVGGEGAGATLAAAATRRIRDRGCQVPAAQILVCPLTDAAAIDADSVDEPGDVLFSAATILWALDQYAPTADRSDPDLSPLRTPDLAGLSPALIVVAGDDPLAAQGVAFARALEAAGVPVTLRSYDGQMHGFFSLVEMRLGERAFQDVVKVVRALWVAQARRQAALQAQQTQEVA